MLCWIHKYLNNIIMESELIALYSLLCKRKQNKRMIDLVFLWRFFWVSTVRLDYSNVFGKIKSCIIRNQKCLLERKYFLNICSLSLIVLSYVKSGKKSRIFRFLKFDLDMKKIPRDNGVGRANSCFLHFIMKIDSYQRKSNWSENCHISSFCNFFDQQFLLFYWWCLKSLKFYYFSCF